MDLMLLQDQTYQAQTVLQAAQKFGDEFYIAYTQDANNQQEKECFSTGWQAVPIE